MSPPQPTSRSGERRKLPRRGAPAENEFWRILELEKTHLIIDTNLSFLTFLGDLAGLIETPAWWAGLWPAGHMSDTLPLVHCFCSSVVTGVQDFHKDLVEKRKAVERLLRSTSLAAAEAAETPDKEEDDMVVSEDKQKLSTLQQKWTLLWRMSLDMKKKLQDNFANLLQVYAFLASGVAGRGGGL